jgi:transcriptional regulator with XRE-family HTH domain
MNNIFPCIGQRILQSIESKGMSQKDLSEKIGVSKQVMSKIINGKKAINVDEIARIAAAIGVTVDSLLVLGQDSPPEPVYLMMGSIANVYTRDQVRFLDHVMDEMASLKEMLQ